MAIGDAKIVYDFPLKANQGDYNDTDIYQLVFLSDTYASISVTATNPALANYTQTTGGNIAGPITLANLTITRAANVVTYDADDPATIVKHASNPADARTVAIINSTSASNDTMQVFDLTTDGTTPIDMVNNDTAITFHANGLHAITI